MITKKEWQSLMSAQKIKSQVEDHMDEVIKAVVKIYGGKLDWWAYPGADEGGMGEMRVYDNRISVDVRFSSPGSYLDCEHCDLATDFPVEYLFKSVDKIVKEVEQYKSDVEKEEQKKKEKQKKQREARKEKQEKLKRAAASKLTKEEREALGL